MALTYSFPDLEPVHCSMSSSNCCFLTCIQVTLEAGRVVWYSYLFKNFPQFVVIYTVKGFGVINKTGVDVFLELSCSFYDPVDAGNLISGSSAFSKSSLTCGSSHFTYCWSLAWSSHKLYIRRHWTISRDIRQGAKISLCEGIEIIQSLFSRHCGVMLEIDIKLSAKITHMFPSAVRHLPRETYDLAVEASMKLEGWNHRGWSQRRKHLNEKLISK